MCALCTMAMLGCATPPRPAQGWSGRLALTVHESPPQSFSASFELAGNAQNGELRLSGPLGTTLATLDWSPQGARLRQGSAETRTDTMPALLRQLVGTDLPLEALFEWLQGGAAQAPGWSVDLTQRPEGRLRVQRQSPEPQVDLRIVLDTP